MDWSLLPSLSALRAFSAYADTRSVSAAGDALNVSHAAISQQLRGLENHLGLTLLDRSGRQMTLTPEGETLARAALEGFEQMAVTVAALTGADADRPLQISTTPTFASAWLMPRLAGFRARHPDVNLTIDPSAEVRPLSPGGIDVALRYGNGCWPGLEAHLLMTSPIAIVAAPELVDDCVIERPSDLAHFHWLQELGTSEASRWFAKMGVAEDLKNGFTAMPGNLMIEGARAGQGVTITAKINVEDDLATGRLRLLFEDEECCGYYVVTRQGVLRPPLKAFVTWARREAAKT